MAMTWQSLSRLTQSPSAVLTAACSLAALSPSPGRPEIPTATAFQPDDASAYLRATSPRSLGEITELSATLKRPVTFRLVGIGTTNESLSATIMQGTPATA